jgi:methylase of polypeptide subunit release factors
MTIDNEINIPSANENLGLRAEQFSQISRQINAYEEQVETRTIELSIAGNVIEIEVDPKVANPEIMNSGIQVVRLLEDRPEIVKGRIVNDMGTGCGIIGLTCGLLGSDKVIMEDVDLIAVENTRRNIKKLNLESVAEVFTSDLFNAYGDRPKAQVQIFNHPFFSAESIEGKDWTRMMLGGTELFGRYLDEAPKYSTEDAVYIFPWLPLAESSDGSLDNNPGKRGILHGYEVVEIIKQQPVKQGVQQTPFEIYILKRL